MQKFRLVRINYRKDGSFSSYDLLDAENKLRVNLKPSVFREYLLKGIITNASYFQSAKGGMLIFKDKQYDGAFNDPVDTKTAKSSKSDNKLRVIHINKRYDGQLISISAVDVNGKSIKLNVADARKLAADNCFANVAYEEGLGYTYGSKILFFDFAHPATRLCHTSSQQVNRSSVPFTCLISNSGTVIELMPKTEEEQARALIHASQIKNFEASGLSAIQYLIAKQDYALIGMDNEKAKVVHMRVTVQHKISSEQCNLISRYFKTTVPMPDMHTYYTKLAKMVV